jgi:hypothetical protein
MAVANTIGYYDMATIMPVKSLIAQALVGTTATVNVMLINDRTKMFCEFLPLTIFY